MSWKADRSGKVTNLDRSNQPESRITQADTSDPGLLSKLLTRLSQVVAAIDKKWNPDFAEFEILSTGTTSVAFQASLPHNFKSPVVWWVTRVTSTTATTPGVVAELATSTDSTLYLSFTWAATFTIRVEKSQ